MDRADGDPLLAVGVLEQRVQQRACGEKVTVAGRRSASPRGDSCATSRTVSAPSISAPRNSSAASGVSRRMRRVESSPLSRSRPAARALRAAPRASAPWPATTCSRTKPLPDSAGVRMPRSCSASGFERARRWLARGDAQVQHAVGLRRGRGSCRGRARARDRAGGAAVLELGDAQGRGDVQEVPGVPRRRDRAPRRRRRSPLRGRAGRVPHSQFRFRRRCRRTVVGEIDLGILKKHRGSGRPDRRLVSLASLADDLLKSTGVSFHTCSGDSCAFEVQAVT